MQCGLQNADGNGVLQSLEAGWTVDRGLNGDWSPHIFTYFTTNGYSQDGFFIGGYNQQFGWIQYDSNIYPGIGISDVSVIGGPQVVGRMSYQLWEGNWWFQVAGTWLGYYPAFLFGGSGLSRSASSAGFWGEVYTTLGNPLATPNRMGSGMRAETGWLHACFQNNILLQTSPDGAFIEVDFDGAASTDINGAFNEEYANRYYDIRQNMKSLTGWGSYFFAGGAGDPGWVDNPIGSWAGAVQARAGSRLTGTGGRMVVST